MSKNGLKQSLKTINVDYWGSIDIDKAKQILDQYDMQNVKVVQECNDPMKE